MPDRYQLLIENLPDAFAYHQIVTDCNGVAVDYIFIAVNAAFTDMFRLSKDRLLGKRITEVYPNIKESSFDWVSTFGHVALGGEGVSFEHFYEPLGRWYDITAYSGEPGYFAVVFRDITGKMKQTAALRQREALHPGLRHDLTERAEAEQQLGESEEKYRALVDQSLDMLYLHDLEGNFIEVNRAAVRESGYAKEELLQMDVFDLHPDRSEREETMRAWKGWRAGEPITLAARHRRKDGSIFPVEVTTSKVFLRGKQYILALAREITSRIQAEEALKKQLALAQIISQISAAFVNPGIIDEGIELALELTGEYFDVDRTYLFQSSPDARQVSNTQEWCKPGIEPQRQNLQNLPVNDIPWWIEQLTGSCTINIPSVTQMPPQAAAEQAILISQSIQSVLVVPLISAQKLLGFMGFDFVRAEKTWTEEEISMLKVIAEIVATALGKQRAEQEKVRAHLQLLKILDHIDAFIYAADFHTYELLFVNRYGLSVFGDVMGKKCWQALQKGQTAPCEFCPNDKLLDAAGQPAGIYRWDFKNTMNGRWYECRDSALTWVDGRMVRLEIASDITERKQLQVELQSERNELFALLEEMLETSAIWIMILDEEFNVTFWNKAAAEISGYAASEIVGKMQIEELFFPVPKYRADIVAAVRHALQSRGKLENLETRIRCKDGQDRTISWHANTYMKEGRVAGYIALGADISERKAYLEALQASEERYRQLVENANEAIIVIQDNLIKFANPQALQIFGCAAAELTTTPFDTFIHPDDKEATLKRHNEKIKGEDVAPSYIFRLQARDGAVKLIEKSSVIIKWEGRSAILGFLADITVKTRMEEELAKKEKLESLGILASGIAHDFNNFLAALLGNISMAKLYKGNPQKIFEKMENMEKVTLRAKDLTNQLFTFTKGSAPVKKKSPLNNLIIDNVNFALSGSHVSCNLNLANNLYPAEIDEGQFSQVLNNIVFNAAQAMPEGGVIQINAENISLDQAELRESAIPLPEGPYLKISIKDEGSGIAEENLLKIFDPFFTTKTGGKGLGLAISYSIIQKHGGHLSVASKPGRGSTFFIYLPAALEDRMAGAEKKYIRSGTAKLLLMDDEEDYLTVTGEALSALGYNVTLAREGREAISLYMDARKTGRPFDLVLMDLTIPGGMGGKQAISELLKRDPEVKAIVCSGYSHDPIMANFRKYGFKGVMKKPFLIDDLSRLIHEILA
jgi:two-component system, cell cycle sensor histidine kinase and response regulator CckA